MHLVPALELCSRLIRRLPREFDSTPAPPVLAGRHTVYRALPCTQAQWPGKQPCISGRPRRQQKNI